MAGTIILAGSNLVAECAVPGRGLKLDLVLKSVAPVDCKPQYWPLFNADNPDECFGNMLLWLYEDVGRGMHFFR